MNISRVTVKSVRFHRNNSMSVTLSDSRIITVPLKWYPRLANASLSAKRNWEPCGAGTGLHWPDVDEDLSIQGLLLGQPSPEYRNSRSKSRKPVSPEIRV